MNKFKITIKNSSNASLTVYIILKKYKIVGKFLTKKKTINKDYLN